MTPELVIIGILTSGIRLATPYLYAAIGETFGQRSGVLNLGVDGQMVLSDLHIGRLRPFHGQVDPFGAGNACSEGRCAEQGNDADCESDAFHFSVLHIVDRFVEAHPGPRMHPIAISDGARRRAAPPYRSIWPAWCSNETDGSSLQAELRYLQKMLRTLWRIGPTTGLTRYSVTFCLRAHISAEPRCAEQMATTDGTSPEPHTASSNGLPLGVSSDVSTIAPQKRLANSSCIASFGSVTNSNRRLQRPVLCACFRAERNAMSASATSTRFATLRRPALCLGAIISLLRSAFAVPVGEHYAFCLEVTLPAALGLTC